MKLDNALRSAMANQIVAAIANGTIASPKLQIYNGTMPTNIGDAFSGTLLAELAISNAVGTVSNGVLTFGTITDDSAANATGTPTWARILDRAGGERIYMTASAQGGSGEVQVNPGTITVGEAVSATLGIIRAGA